MPKRIRKAKNEIVLTKEEDELVDEISKALELRGFIRHNYYWTGHRYVNYVSVWLNSDRKLSVRVIHGSIKEGWEDFVLPLDMESVSKICINL